MTEIPVPNLDAPTAAPSPAPASEPAAPTTDATPAAPSPAPDAPAVPSPAPDATPASSPGNTDPKTGLLAAVKKAVEPKTTADPAAASAQAKPDADPDKGPDPEELPENVTQEETKNYSPKAQKRISKLLQQREEARAEARAVVSEVEPFRAFMQENDLGSEDLAFGLQALATLRKGDFEGFLAQVQPFVQLAEEYTGRRLPEDLQRQVQQGRMAPDVAVGMSRQRMDLGRARQQLDQHAQYEAQRREEEGRETNRSAVAVWEQSIKASDPDYARKLDVAKAFVASIKAEHGDPQTPEDALAVAKEAYRRASESMRAALPPRAATQMSPSGVQRPSNPSAVPSPRSLMDAVQQALARR